MAKTENYYAKALIGASLILIVLMPCISLLWNLVATQIAQASSNYTFRSLEELRVSWLVNNRKRLSLIASNLGYPAPESEIIPGRYYLCNFSIVDAHPTSTNYFAVLQESAPTTNAVAILGSNRLFTLPQALSGGTLYLAGKGSSNIVYHPIGAFK